jgi:multisubunit Na+/H+ antiporter MnhF subunit
MRIDLPVLLDVALAAVLIGFLATIGLARLVPVRRAVQAQQDRPEEPA